MALKSGNFGAYILKSHKKYENVDCKTKNEWIRRETRFNYTFSYLDFVLKSFYAGKDQRFMKVSNFKI